MACAQTLVLRVRCVEVRPSSRDGCYRIHSSKWWRLLSIAASCGLISQ